MRLAGLLLLPPVSVVAQPPPCPANVQNLSQQATISATNNAKTCAVTDGGYLKTSTTYRLHVEAAASGTCQTYTRNGAVVCVNDTLFNRTAISAHQDITGNQIGYSVLANNNVQNYTTCGSGSCTPVNTSNN